MKLVDLTFVIMIIVVLMYVAQVKEQGYSLDDVNLQLKTTENVLSLNSSSMMYKSAYDSNNTIKDYVNNMVYVFAVGFIGIINTLTGAVVNLSWNYMTIETIRWGFIGIIAAVCIILISKLFVPVVATYMLVGEVLTQKGWKHNWITKTVYTIAIWSLIGSVLTLMTVLIF